ncbi:MAG: DegV family protein [Candidatus Eremiobacteraeota bacterium]|nr:DegV family protein [Candidatus Eremiobacteraeota bacterium]
MAIVVITDSASDLPPAQARENGIEIVPLWIVFGNERLRDGIDITRATFYDRMAQSKELPHSEPLDAAGFATVFSKHVEAGDECIVPLVGAKLSKTYENAVAGAAAFGSKVRVVDTASLSGGEGLQAVAAAEMARAGASADEIVAALERAKASQFGYQVMPTLEYLGRAGRLNKAIVALGTVLKVNPILQVKNGTVETAGQTRTWEKAKELVVDIAARNIQDVTRTRIAVGHTHEPAVAEEISDALRAKLGLPAKSFTLYEVGPTVAVNVGPGAVAIFSLSGI